MADLVEAAVASEEDAPVIVNSEYMEVEKIVRKSIRRGVTWYLIKWAGYATEHNTWEPAENLGSGELIKDFEEREKLKRRRRSTVVGKSRKRAKVVTKRSRGSTSTSTFPSSGSGPSVEAVEVKEEPEDNFTTFIVSPGGTPLPEEISIEHSLPQSSVQAVKYGFDAGWEAEAVEALVRKRGDDRVHYVLRWKDRDECGLVSSDACRTHIPMMICEYLEYNLPLLPVPEKELKELKGKLPNDLSRKLGL